MILHHAYLTQIEDQPISDFSDVQCCIAQACHKGQKSLHCHFATICVHTIHSKAGIPQISFSQVNIIAKHIKDLKAEATSTPAKHPDIIHSVDSSPDALLQKFVHSQLVKQDDWTQWQQSKYRNWINTKIRIC